MARSRRSLRFALAALVAAVTIGSCAPAEYTTTHAHDDLVRIGWTSSQAQCLLDGLRAFYGNRYVEANRREDARRHLKFTGVNPRGSDLYVRNELSNSGSLSDAETAEARTLAERCRP